MSDRPSITLPTMCRRARRDRVRLSARGGRSRPWRALWIDCRGIVGLRVVYLGIRLFHREDPVGTSLLRALHAILEWHA